MFRYTFNLSNLLAAGAVLAVALFQPICAQGMSDCAANPGTILSP